MGSNEMKFLILLIIFSLIFSTTMNVISYNNDKSNELSDSGETLFVGGDGPGNYSTIQDAINNATDGDTIFVYNGLYAGGIEVDKSIVLVGQDKVKTFIEGTSGPGQNGISVYVDGVTIRGFSFQRIGNFWPEAAIYINSNNNKVHDNIITNNKFGIDLMQASNNSIFNNLIINQVRYQGMYISYSDNNRIFNNIIANNNGGALTIADSYFNVISNNTISHNKWGGVVFIDESEGKNLIYNNNFFNNVPDNGNDKGINNWDNGYYDGGNYWDDYKGDDSDGDGIGDTPYEIDGGDNKDKYPLMEPIDIPKLIIFFKNGFKEFTIKNIGNKIAYGVKWEINLNGGLILFGRESEGMLSEPLQPNEEYDVVTKTIFGFGQVLIIIKLWANNYPVVEDTTKGLVILFFIML